MSVRFLLSICLLVALPSPGGAQESAPAPAKTLDFSDGFRKLVALGLPPLDATAKWVVTRQGYVPYQFRQSVKAFKGNAWLTGSGKEAKLVLLGAVEATAGKPTNATPDLDKDVAALVAAIKKSDPTDDESDDLLGGRYSSGNVAPDILLFATQLYQTGRAAQANQLATALFAAVPQREPVVDGVIDRLGGHAYAGVFEAFATSGDWAAYHLAVTELFARFPRGWADREAVALFLPQLEKQAKGAKPQPPAIAGVEIDPRAITILAELTAKPADKATDKSQTVGGLEGISPEMLESLSPAQARMLINSRMGGGQGSVGGTWLLDPPSAATPQSPQSPLARLTALNLAALPALAALLDDPFLTHLANERSDRDHFGYSNDSAEEALARKYEALRRPQTRGEIARRLLLATLPDPDNEFRQADDETLRQATLEFWRANRTATRDELAAVYLRGGSKAQASTAVAILAASAEPKFHQLFEAHVLAQDPAFATYQDVRTYLKARKGAAKPFFESYAKLVRSQTPADAHKQDDSYDGNSYMLRNLGGVEKLLKSLSGLIEPEAPRAVAVRIAKGDPKGADEAIKALHPMMEDLSPIKQLHAWLEGANAATDASVRARFLHGALRVRWPRPDRAPAADEDDEAPPQPATEGGKPPAPAPVRTVSEPEAKVWRKLMADPRKPEDELIWLPFGGSGAKVATVAELAYAAYEQSVHPGGLNQLAAATGILDKTFTALLKETVTARLAGQPVPALPDADRVTAERLAAIVTAAGGKKPAEIPAYIKSLTADERAAWREWIDDPEDPEAPGSVKALAWYVAQRDEDDDSDDPSDPAKTIATVEPGFMLTPEWLVAHLASLAPKVDSFSPYGIFFFTDDMGLGLTVGETLLDTTPPAAPKGAKPKEPKPDRGGDEDGSADEDADEEPNPLAGWRGTYSSPRAALLANPDAVAAVTVSCCQRDREVTLLFTKDGKLAVAKDPDADEPAPSDPLASLKPLFDETDGEGLTAHILTRKHAEILFKGSDDEELEGPFLLPPP